MSIKPSQRQPESANEKLHLCIQLEKTIKGEFVQVCAKILYSNRLLLYSVGSFLHAESDAQTPELITSVTYSLLEDIFDCYNYNGAILVFLDKNKSEIPLQEVEQSMKLFLEKNI